MLFPIPAGKSAKVVYRSRFFRIVQLKRAHHSVAPAALQCLAALHDPHDDSLNCRFAKTCSMIVQHTSQGISNGAVSYNSVYLDPGSNLNMKQSLYLLGCSCLVYIHTITYIYIHAKWSLQLADRNAWMKVKFLCKPPLEEVCHQLVSLEVGKGLGKTSWSDRTLPCPKPIVFSLTNTTRITTTMSHMFSCYPSLPVAQTSTNPWDAMEFIEGYSISLGSTPQPGASDPSCYRVQQWHDVWGQGA